MKKIQLTHGQVTFVSDCDYKELIRFKWQAFWNPPTKSYYAVRTEYPTSKTIRTHRYILGILKGVKIEGHTVDHKNHLTLDNTRRNLRKATYAQNNQHARIRKDNTSGAKGVCRKGKKWYMQISANKKRFVKTYNTFEEAVKAYQLLVKKLHKNFRIS